MRPASLLLGLMLVALAIASPVAALDARMLTAHMVQHLLLMTLAPPLILFGAPKFRWPALPLAVCWLAATAVLVGWHIPALFRLAMQSAVWHGVEQASFLAAGLLFWRPVIQPAPQWPILLYLFFATLPCDILSASLVFSDRVAYPMYLCVPPNSGASVLDDQQCAGALMWTCVTIVYLVAGTVVATRMLSLRNDPQSLEVV